MDRDQIKGRWMQIKGEVKKLYGKLTDDDFKQAEGDLDILTGKIVQQYGEAKDKVRAKLEQIINRIVATPLPTGGSQPMQPPKMPKTEEEKKRDVA